jgi:putative ubiquitin-RnfH superfamily antitoxin RatB of RatAB toxin-antitoxin module
VPAENLAVEVVYCPRPGETDLVGLSLPAGSTAAEALRASGLPARHGLGVETLQMGLWGRRCDAGVVLRDRDRLEIYRPLQVDPKEARRQRYRRHREKPPAR